MFIEFNDVLFEIFRRIFSTLALTDRLVLFSPHRWACQCDVF